MIYIWINPVTDNMYDTDELNEFLKRNGYKRFYSKTDYLSEVKEKYKSKIKESSKVVADMRCPKVIELLCQMGQGEYIDTPSIDPILIHYGMESCDRSDLRGAAKIITTPCQALADMGNAITPHDVWFISWKKFIENIGEEPRRIVIKDSPIPLGFFDDLGIKVDSISGEEEIKKYLLNIKDKDARLIEMLYCENGCHNGDGIPREEIVR